MCSLFLVYPPLHLTLTPNTVIKEKPFQSVLDRVRSPCKAYAETLGMPPCFRQVLVLQRLFLSIRTDLHKKYDSPMRHCITPMITMTRFGTSTQATVSSGWRSLKKRVPPQFRLHAVALPAVKVRTERPGGEVQIFTFTNKDDFLESLQAQLACKAARAKA